MNGTANVQLLPGAQGIKSAYELSLKAKQVDIICLSHRYAEVIGSYFEKEYSPRLFGGTIMTREILPNTVENRADNKEKDPSKNPVKFIQAETSESDMLLFNTTAILISYNRQSPFALVITDAELTASLKTQFEALWNKLEA